jgi:hypothetical protein
VPGVRPKQHYSDCASAAGDVFLPGLSDEGKAAMTETWLAWRCFISPAASLQFSVRSAPNIAMRIIVYLACTAICFGLGQAACAADPVAAALQASLNKNISHARAWLEGGDFKSLAQSTNGLQLLAELWQARSDDAAWQTASGKVLSAISDLQKAVPGNDVAKCKANLEAVEKAISATAVNSPNGKPKAPARQVAVRPLMLVLDSVYADAKMAALTSKPDEAKKAAYVLSELGRLVSNSQSNSGKGREKWPELGEAFVEASLAAAQSPAEDAASVKQLLRAVSQRCEACHETRSR